MLFSVFDLGKIIIGEFDGYLYYAYSCPSIDKHLMAEIEFNFPFLSRLASSLQLFGALVVNLMREGRDHVTMSLCYNLPFYAAVILIQQLPVNCRIIAIQNCPREPRELSHCHNAL